jgi:hypothetical protein
VQRDVGDVAVVQRDDHRRTDQRHPERARTLLLSDGNDGLPVGVFVRLDPAGPGLEAFDPDRRVRPFYRTFERCQPTDEGSAA